MRAACVKGKTQTLEHKRLHQLLHCHVRRIETGNPDQVVINLVNDGGSQGRIQTSAAQPELTNPTEHWILHFPEHSEQISFCDVSVA